MLRLFTTFITLAVASSLVASPAAAAHPDIAFTGAIWGCPTNSAKSPVKTPTKKRRRARKRRQSALFTPGNTWIYATLRAHRADLYGGGDDDGPIAYKRLRVTGRRTVGRLLVADIAIAQTRGRKAHWTPAGKAHWVTDGKKTWWVDSLPSKSRRIKKLLASRHARLLVGGHPMQRVTCTRIGCMVTNVSERSLDFVRKGDTTGWSGERRLRYWPGVGPVQMSEGTYSAKTGDGGEDHYLLVAYSIAGRLTHTATVHAEPAASQRARRMLGAAMRRGGIKGMKPFIAKRVYRSIVDGWGELVPNRNEVLKAWSHRGSPGRTALEQLLVGPCALVRESAEYVVCPPPVAKRSASVASACTVGPATPKARAVFERFGAAWKLSWLLLGGDADIFDRGAPWQSRDGRTVWPTMPAAAHTLKTVAKPEFVGADGDGRLCVQGRGERLVAMHAEGRGLQGDPVKKCPQVVTQALPKGTWLQLRMGRRKARLAPDYDGAILVNTITPDPAEKKAVRILKKARRVSLELVTGKRRERKVTRLLKLRDGMIQYLRVVPTVAADGQTGLAIEAFYGTGMSVGPQQLALILIGPAKPRVVWQQYRKEVNKSKQPRRRRRLFP